MAEKKSQNKMIVYVVGFVAALAGLLFGLDVGVISGVLPILGKEWGIDAEAKEFIVTALLIGAFAGTIISGFISSKFGRKNAILVSAVIFAVGSLLCAVSQAEFMLVTVRFFLGMAIGIASFTAPLYLSEMAPEKVRGAMISMYQLMITIGIVLAFLSDTVLSYGAHWRVMLGIIAIPAALMFVGVCFLPESPRWLFLVERKDEAAEVLKRLRNTLEEAEQELEEIEKNIETKQESFQFLKNRNFIKALGLGIALQAAQQFTGINVVMYYAPKIFEDAGFASSSQQMWGTVLIGVTNVLATFIAIAFVDKMGRKPILYAGYIIMGISMAVLGLMFNIGITSSATVQYSAIAALVIFIIGFAMSAGPIIWVICSEIYPLAGRDLGVTVSTATNWLCNAVVGATFLTLLNRLGDAHTFWLFGLINFSVLLLLAFFVPETKGVSLEKIEEDLLSGVPLRKLGRS